jgi:putative copper resistance protein D
VGGVIFRSFLKSSELVDSSIQSRFQRLMRIAASALSITAVCSIVLTLLVLDATNGTGDRLEIFRTSFGRAELMILVASLWIALQASRTPRWLAFPAAMIVAGSVLTSHAYGRIDDRGLLLSSTTLHHLATAAWIGSLPWLLIVLRQGSSEFAVPIARRFSRLAIAGAGILIGFGLVLSFWYVGDFHSVYGTSYGIMLMAKIVLLGLILTMGGANFLLLKRNPNARSIVKTVVEVELAVGITAVLVAASLTSKPPAVDVPGGRISLQSFTEVLYPRSPRLQTPSLSSLSPATPLNEQEARDFGRPLSYTPGVTYSPPLPADIEWSEYNHSWAGIFLLGMGLLALVAQTPGGAWARNWPLGFLGLGVFILLRADPENWPLGPRGFWESFQVAEVTQHRAAVLLIALFAFFEWRVATGRKTLSWYPLVFPAVCAIGGALLFSHTHSLENVPAEARMEVNHTGIALFAIAAGGARWLQLRLSSAPAVLRLVWPVAFMMIGVLLVSYREA